MPTYNKGWRQKPTNEDELREFIRHRTSYAAEKNQGFLRMLRKLWRYYLTTSQRFAWRKDNDRDPGSGFEWRADLFVPASFSVIETAVPRIIFALFGSRPFVKVQGREMQDEMRARAVESLLDYDFEQSELLFKAIEFFKSFYIFGTAVARIDYHRDFYFLEGTPQYDVEITWGSDGEISEAKPRRTTPKERITRYDGPRLENVSVFDFFPDPMFNTIEDMRYVVEREVTTRAKLDKANEQYKDLTGKSLYKNLDRIQPFKHSGMSELGADEDLRDETADIFHFNTGFGKRSGAKEDLDEDAVVLFHYWEDDRYTILANGREVIRDGKNPYNDKRKPYVSAACFPTLKEFYGQGLLAPIQYLQEELNTLRNIALDQGKLNLYGVWAVDNSITLNESDMALYPGKVIPTDFESGKPLAQQIFNTTLPADYERLEGRVQSDIQSTLAINDYMVGAGKGSAGTASEASMLQASAQNRFRLQAILAQEKFLTGCADMFLSRRQQFLDEKKVFRVLGEGGLNYPQIGPGEIAGKFDFVPLGSQSHPNKEVTRQQLMALVPIMAQNPILLQQTNWKELHKELFNSFDFRYPERFIIDSPMDEIPQEQENYILQMGEEVRVRQTDDHQTHYELVQQAIEQGILIQQETGNNRPLIAAQKHAEEHRKYLEMMQQTAGGSSSQPGGLPSGPPASAPGNQPTQPSQSTPSLPSMIANVQGGPGGPIG